MPPSSGIIETPGSKNPGHPPALWLLREFKQDFIESRRVVVTYARCNQIMAALIVERHAIPADNNDGTGLKRKQARRKRRTPDRYGAE